MAFTVALSRMSNNESVPGSPNPTGASRPPNARKGRNHKGSTSPEIIKNMIVLQQGLNGSAEITAGILSRRNLLRGKRMEPPNAPNGRNVPPINWGTSPEEMQEAVNIVTYKKLPSSKKSRKSKKSKKARKTRKN